VECFRVNACNAGFPTHLHDEYVISANLTGVEEIWLAGKPHTLRVGR